MDESELLSTREAAKLLGIHYNTMTRMTSSEIPFFRIGSRGGKGTGDRRYRRSDVEAYIERRMER